MKNKIRYFYFSFLLFLVKNSNIIKISLDTYIQYTSDFFILENDNNYNNSYSKKYFIDNLIDSSLYSLMSIGDPQYKIKTLLSTQNPYLFLSYSFETKNEKNINYNIYNSKTFKNISITGEYYVKSKQDIKIKEKLEIPVIDYNNNKTKKIEIDDMNIILTNNENNNKNKDGNKIYNLNIGLKILYNDINPLEKYKYIFIYQLKQKNIINNYHFSLFFEKGKNKKGENLYNLNELTKTKAELIIGDYPHNYKPYLLDESQLITILSNNLYWGLYFSNIYYYINDNMEKQIVGCPNAELDFNDFLINAPITYFDYIKKHFFQKYLSENICKTDYTGELLIIFCIKSENFTINEIKEFPTIYFQHDEFRYIFELTYEDLFIEKDDKFWFLVVFESYFDTDKWFLVNIFLRKYYFVFNQDSKTIGFYNLNLPRIENKNKEKEVLIVNKKLNWKYIIILLSIFGIIFIYIGIIITKFIYKNISSKKSALELKDKNEYINNKDINKQESNNQTLEMKYKLIKS